MTASNSSITKHPLFKVGIILLIIISGILLVTFTPLGAYITDIKRVRADIESAGIWSYLIFIVVFVVFALFNIPEAGFLFLSYLIFDNIFLAAFINYTAGMLSALATFYTGRLIGAGALHEIKNQRIKRLLATAENNPIRSLLILRTFLMLNPIVGYTLALTKMSPRNYIIGNLIGIMVPIVYITLGMYFARETLFSYFEIEY
jgi:uncharacterized membrane protein YdjX (TVP38/TMEM64 family)